MRDVRGQAGNRSQVKETKSTHSAPNELLQPTAENRGG
jgi:hypothetical protein